MISLVLGISVFAFLISCGSKKTETSEENETTEQVAVNNQADIDSITKLVYLLYFDPAQLNEDYDGTPAYTSAMKERMSKVGILSSDGKSLVSQEISEDQYTSQDLKKLWKIKIKISNSVNLFLPKLKFGVVPITWLIM